MSKEYIEALDWLEEKCYVESPQAEKFEECCKIIRQFLHRLESIDNANPSEALEAVKQIEFYVGTIIGLKFVKGNDVFSEAKKQDYEIFERKCNTIEQALLKAQEQKQYVDELKLVEKKLKALEILKQNVKVSIDYGEEKDISMALVFYIDNKKTIYVVDEAIKEQNPEHFKELELLKEVLE